MAETPDQIRKHIANLTAFEEKFGEYVGALKADLEVESVVHSYRIENDGPKGSGWSDDEFSARKREVAGLAAKADRAIGASGVGRLTILYPPALGGGIKSADLPSQVFDFVEFGYGDDGLSFQRDLLDRIPAQIAGLEMKLEEAEEAEKEAGDKLFGEVFQESQEKHWNLERERERRRHEESLKSSEPKRVPSSQVPVDSVVEPAKANRAWHESPVIVPLVIGTVATVVGGLILAAILGLFS